MNKNITKWICCLSLISICCVGGRDVEAVPASRQAAPADNIICVVDACTINLAGLLQNPQDVWMIAQQKPGQHSVPNWFGIIHSGQSYITIDNKSHDDLFGTLTVRDVLQGSPGFHTEDYSWPISPIVTQYNTVFETNNIFAEPSATFLCQLHPDKQGPDRYNPVYQFPDSWRPLVRQAWNYVKAHPTLFAAAPNEAVPNEAVPALNDAQVTILTSLLNDPNPVLVSQAAYRLSASNHFTCAEALTFVSRALRMQGMSKAVYVYLALTAASETDLPAVQTALAQDIDACQDANALAGLALAVWAAVFAHALPEGQDVLYDHVVASWQKFSHQPQLPINEASAPGIADKMSSTEAINYLTALLTTPNL